MENFVYIMYDFFREKGKESWFVFDVEIYNYMFYQSYGILYFNISNLKDELIRNVYELLIFIEVCILIMIY